jgi:hypothetical protein
MRYCNLNGILILFIQHPFTINALLLKAIFTILFMKPPIIFYVSIFQQYKV